MDTEATKGNPRQDGGVRLTTKEYRRVSKRSAKWRETNDCTVKALAIATKSTYEKAHGALALRGRNFGKGVHMEAVWGALAEFGFEAETVFNRREVEWDDDGWTTTDAQKERAKNYRRSRWAKGKTIKSVAGYLPQRGVFLIETRAHVLCVRAGKVHDWTDGRRHRITKVHRIIRRKEK